VSKGNVVHLFSGKNKNTQLDGLLEQMSTQAHAGELVGAVVIGIYRAPPIAGDRRATTRPEVHLTGLAREQPLLAVGAMATAEVLVKELALEMAGIL
jgi:hypothetical protein